MIYDVAVVGLGPAGSTLARLLSPKLKVIGIDKKSNQEESGFTKCCGGLLSDDAQRSMARLGLVLPKDVLVNPQIFSVRTIDVNQEKEKYYQRFYLNMDRHAFDLWLMSLIPDSVELRENASCSDIQRLANGNYEVKILRGGKYETIVAKIVVGADGAGSIVRRKIGKEKGEVYVAIQEWYHAPKQKPFYVSLFDEKISDSYGWALSKDEYFIAGIAVPIEEANQRFEIFKDHLRDRGFILDKRVKREGSPVRLTRSLGDQYVGEDGVYFIGEAGGFISSSSLEGMSYGMDSASLLATVLNESLDHITSRYRKATFGLRMKLTTRIMKRFFIYRPVVRKWIMKSGLQSIRVDQVE